MVQNTTTFGRHKCTNTYLRDIALATLQATAHVTALARLGQAHQTHRSIFLHLLPFAASFISLS